MPTYCHICSVCGRRIERVAPMAESGRVPPCPNGCGLMERDLRAERPSVSSFEAYESASVGAMPHEMERAHQRGRDWFVKDADGGERQLNPPGFDLNPKTGNVLLATSAQRRRLIAQEKLVDLSDYGSVHDENERRKARFDQRARRARKHQAEALRRGVLRHKKLGWGAK